MRIDVTQADIDKGEIGCSFCPVAHAVRRATGHADVTVNRYWIIINGERHATPDSVRSFIRQFDLSHPVSPIYFALPIESTRTAVIPVAAVTRAAAEACHECN